MAGARKLMPKMVVNSFGSLFNDETYSDVEFWLPSRRRKYKKVLGEAAAVDGVQQESGHEFAKTNTTTTTTSAQVTSPMLLGNSPSTSLSNDAELHGDSPTKQFSTLTGAVDATQLAGGDLHPAGSSPGNASNAYYRKIWANKKILRRGEFFKDLLSGSFSEGNDPPVSQFAWTQLRLPQLLFIESRPDTPGADSDLYGWDDSDIDEEMHSDSEDGPLSSDRRQSTGTSHNDGPRKTKIVIRDAAYTSWQALIYWLYTDEIVFAPLASTFISAEPDCDQTSRAVSGRPTHVRPASIVSPDRGGAGRTAWIQAWVEEREGSEDWPENAPRPCSAKAIFRLADVSCRRILSDQ